MLSIKDARLVGINVYVHILKIRNRWQIKEKPQTAAFPPAVGYLERSLKR